MEFRTDKTGYTVIYMVQHFASKMRVNFHDTKPELKLNWGLG